MTGTDVAARIVRVNVPVPVPPALVALMLTLEVPAVVGVPEMMPVSVSRLRPSGRSVAAKLVGESLAVMVKLKAVPTTPDAVLELEITGAGGLTVMDRLAVPVP